MVIDEVQSTPSQDVLIVCQSLCNSNAVQQRVTRQCTDQKCENLCAVISGILDNDIATAIEDGLFRELSGMCRGDGLNLN